MKKRLKMNLLLIFLFLLISLSIFAINLSTVPSVSLILLTLLSPLFGGPIGVGTPYGYGNYGENCYGGLCVPFLGTYGSDLYGGDCYGGVCT